MVWMGTISFSLILGPDPSRDEGPFAVDFIFTPLVSNPNWLHPMRLPPIPVAGPVPHPGLFGFGVGVTTLWQGAGGGS